MDRSYPRSKLLLKFLPMVFPAYVGVDSLKISSLEIQRATNSLFLDPRNLLCGLLIQHLANANTKPCKQELWSETIPAWLSLSQTRSSCLPELSLVTSALSRSKTRCSSSVNLFALKVLKESKQLPMTRYALEVVTVKLCCSTLTRISASHWCNVSSMEVFRVSVLVRMVFKCLPQPIRVSFTDWESATSRRCCWQKIMLSQSFMLTTCKMCQINSLPAVLMEPWESGMPTTTLSKLVV